MLLRFLVLGPVELHGQSQFALTAPMQRALLGHLLLNAGRPMRVTELARRLWRDDGPSQPRSAVQLLVLRLRRALDEFGCETRIDSMPGTYQLQLAGADLDSLQFESLVRRAERERELGDVVAERSLLGAALELWRGPVLGDPSAGLTGSTEMRHLATQRIAVVERLAEVEIERDRPERAIGLVRSFLPAEPAREQLRHLLMLGLYRAGRRAEALAAYEDAYRYAVDELGLEPGQPLRELQSRILRGEYVDPAVVRTHPRPQYRPDVLPTRLSGFVGREAPLRDIARRLTGQTAAAGTVVCGIAGMVGIGKSALAVQIANRVRDRFPDGQLYADFADGEETGAVLAGFLGLLGCPTSAIPASLLDRMRLFRAYTGGRRILVLVDGARDAKQVRALLPGDGRSAVLVTSRRVLAEVDGARWTHVDVLTSDESITLLGALVGRSRLSRERAEAARVAEYCCGLPLALRVVGARLATRPSCTLTRIATELAEPADRLARLTIGALSVERAIAASCHHCPLDEQQLLNYLAVSGQEWFTVDDAAELAHLSRGVAGALLENLRDHQLVQVTGSGGYRLHSLVRLYLDSERPAPLARTGYGNGCGTR